MHLSLGFQKWSQYAVCVCVPFWLWNVLRATTACTFSTSEPPKVVRTCGAFNIFTSNCASRHGGVHFWNSSTAKGGPNMWCFYHFDLEACFAPQWCALFNIWTSKSALNPRCFLTCSLRHVLRATSAGTFGASQLPKVLRSWSAFNI